MAFRLGLRSKGPYWFFALLGTDRERILEWKKRSDPALIAKDETAGVDPEVFEALCEAIESYGQGFDFLTVPAPSFHTYENYPVWFLAQAVGRKTGLPVRKLFTRPSGKTDKFYGASLRKKVQNIDLEPGLFVLVLDDVATTRWTMVVTYEAILRKGSYPCGLVMTIDS